MLKSILANLPLSSSRHGGWALVLVALVSVSGTRVLLAEMPVEEAWKALPKYEYGQDMAALLTVERVAIQAMASPESRAACAARMAALLDADDTTLAARQMICLQLRQVGTSAEVPVLTRLLGEPETSQMARAALDAIPGEESLAALRGALKTLDGTSLLGAIDSVAARKDSGSVPALRQLADSRDTRLAAAALRALGDIGNAQAFAFLRDRAEKGGAAVPHELAIPLLRCADALAAAGKSEAADAVYSRLSRVGPSSGVRRAALEGLLRFQGANTSKMIVAWFAGADAERRLVASGHLGSLSDPQLDQLVTDLDTLPDTGKLTLMEVLTRRRGRRALPVVVSLAGSDRPELKTAAIRCLGRVGDRSVVPFLVDRLAAGGTLTAAAQQALCGLPRQEVAAPLVDALRNRPDLRMPVIEVLKKRRCIEAIVPLIGIAAETDRAAYGPALDGLRGIADPDKDVILRLVELLPKTGRGRHRDEVEKTIVIVCSKLPGDTDRARPVLAALARIDSANAARGLQRRTHEYLPLLGRLGGRDALAMIDSALASTNAEVKEAAVRALCHWPTTEVAERLLKISAHSDSKTFRHWALRAYVRVVSLKSDRPEAQTLAMLQNAMQLAEETGDRQLVLRRAATVRTLETVLWIAPYLDDPTLAQTACEAIVELAHHRFLRHPNIDRFAPILERVSKITTDTTVAERAKRYRLGL